MKILLSAYACEPNKGSEPEVGWRWVLETSKKYDEVVVVTRTNNKKSIEKELKKLKIYNVKFEYFDLPEWIRFLKKGNKGIQVYVYLWEILVFFFLFKKYKKNEFDISQRVTFVSYRFPTFIWYFGKKFILGPVAGGERFPINFLKIFSLKGKIKEIIRMFIQKVSLFDPLVLLTFYKADKIIVVTEDTKNIFPKFIQKKTIIKPAIQIDKNDFEIKELNVEKKYNDKLKLLYVGRLLEWKGLMLLLKALQGIDNSKYVLTIIGDGNDKKIFENYVKKHNLNVIFLGKIKRKELSKYYLSSDLFIFPSLHDSGGMVILEAKAHGMKVVVSNFGGPKMFVDKNDFIIKEITADKFVKKMKSIILNEI